MADRTFLDWPFFEDRHRAFAADIDGWCEANGETMHLHGDHDLDGDCRAILKALAAGSLSNLMSAALAGLFLSLL